MRGEREKERGDRENRGDHEEERNQ